MASTEGGYGPPGAADPPRGETGGATATPAYGSPTFGFEQTFDEDSLYALRSAVAAHATDFGLGEAKVADLVLVAHELASNAVRHGRATSLVPARIELWREDHSLLCRVSDAGPGIAEPDVVGTVEVPLSASSGRGLWIIRQVVDALEIRTGATGTVITAALGISSSVE
jgi:anti-sigma regulatory factor (Ser/Thr protein kinase)